MEITLAHIVFAILLITANLFACHTKDGRNTADSGFILLVVVIDFIIFILILIRFVEYLHGFKLFTI